MWSSPAAAALYSLAPDIKACTAGALSVPQKRRVLETMNAIRALQSLAPVTYDESAGAGVMRSFLRRFGLAPQISDGSGLSRANRTSPREVVALLTAMHNDPQRAAFEDSLAVAGRSGTLAGRMNGSAAEGKCRGKTGTLSDVSALSGLCLTKSGHVIVFSILMNGVSPSSARSLQDSAVKAIANYSD